MNKFLIAILIIVATLAYATNTYANPGGNGQGNGQGYAKGNPPIVNTVITDPKTGTTMVVPAKSVTTVPGNPPGWNKGKKVGWGNNNVPPGLAKKGVTAQPENPVKHFFQGLFGTTPGKGNDKD